RHDSQAVLTDLERGNLFIVPLDNRREWYRYHRLFADLLRQRLIGSISAAAIGDLHHRASVWFEQHNLLDEAIGQALIAPDYDRAAQLVEKHNQWLFQHSELQTLADYTAALPPAILNQRLPLLAMRGWALLATGQYAEAAQVVKSIQQTAQVDDTSWARWYELTSQAQSALLESSVMTMRFAIDQGDTDHTLSLAQHLLPRLNDDQQMWLYNPSYALRAPVRFMLGMAYELRGNLPSAETEFRTATAEGADNPHIVTLAIGHLGGVLMQQGSLHAAADTYRQALKLAEEMGRYSSPFAGVAQVGYGNLLYEWNDLAAAQEQLQEGIALGQSWNSWEAMIPGYLCLARVKQANADWDGASAALDEMIDRNHGYLPTVPQQADSLRAWLWLRQGRLDAVEHWAHDLELNSHQEITYANENDLLLLAQLLIAQDKLAEADQLLQKLAVATQNGGRCQRYLTALLLRAIALTGLDRSREALQLVNAVLTQAEPESYVRVFVDLGTEVAALLYRAIDHQPTSHYAQRLLSAFPTTDWAAPPDRGDELIEPLSDRE
ncbi:MAG TPA: hypothetical protein VFK30_10925, partial [Anaerolineae bacterium]|nr:hypothetical protein [Anaerolineae bacterium]